MTFSIRWKLIVSIILPLLIIAGVVMGFTLRRVYDSAIRTMQDQHLREISLLATGIDNELDAVRGSVEDSARFLALRPTLNGEAVFNLLKDTMRRDPVIYGAAFAFEPFAWRNDLRLFAPYVFDKDMKQLDLSTVLGEYPSGRVDWYQRVKTGGQPVWTEPYLDSVNRSMPIVTYAVPIRAGGTFIGVATLDLRLDLLNQRLAARMTPSRYLLMTPSGRFLAHYDSSMILNSGLSDMTAAVVNPQFQLITNHIMAGDTGMGVIDNLYLDGGIEPGNLWISYTSILASNWRLATIASESDLIEPVRAQIEIALLGLSLTVLAIFILVWVMSTRLTRPIKTLEAAVSEVAQGHLDTHIENIRSTDELGRLSLGFNRMLKNLKKQIELQSQQETAQKLVERELQMARETQKSLLPTDFPPFPTRKEFELHAVNQAAYHVAGDFFDFFLVNPQTLIFVIADVSGKGMSAALVMAVTRTIVRDLAQSGRPPGEILRETNDRLRDGQRAGAFVTLFLGSYDIATGKVTYANGGHLPPYLISQGGKVGNVGDATGTIVGMLEGMDYRTAEFTLNPGDTLLLYTDGFPEARSPAGEFYGIPRIKAFLQKHAKDNCLELCEAAIAEIANYQNHNLSDDITLLALKRSANSGGFLAGLLRPGT
ncbi:MAG TPA: SpoIIE family protein phosphatase [Candidatus Acidoferrum sp.]|nr:SpoIIE family protein phosphatase [Candidatus Acidoferrum sp.]